MYGSVHKKGMRVEYAKVTTQGLVIHAEQGQILLVGVGVPGNLK